LRESSGTQFDPAVVSSFVQIAHQEMPSVIEAVGKS
jgi:response regulator RpfG family c-di-GMP phosphodiesterase